jgi:iron-sulfur cluster assembly protein
MAITLTQSATDRVRHFLEKENGSVLRLGVHKTGCSGWAYNVGLVSEIMPDDTVFETDGIRVVVDPDSLPYLDGSEIDFVADGLNRTFSFKNPNATDSCGCGESFTIS